MVKQQNSSRFSTLKVFNFAAGGGNGSKLPDPSGSSPPPLPPKDRYYLFNKSMSSLSPDAYSMPSTPLSPAFRRGANPSASSQSTVDLHEFGASPGPSGLSSAQAKKGFFGKLASKSKRGQKSSSTRRSPPADDIQSQAPSEDDGISLPWNFQHNIHVDEGYAGLPPSWSTSLTDAGFNDDEIAAIQARRAASSPILTNPQPRSTSLRQISDTASIASSHRRQPSPRIPLPSLPHGSSPPVRQPSQSRSQYSDSSFESGHPDAQYVYINSRNELTSHAPSESSHVSSEARSQSPAESSNIAPLPRPHTPPKRTFRIVNESPSSVPFTPPPAYKSPVTHSAFAVAAGSGKSAYREEPEVTPRLEPPPPPPPQNEEPVQEECEGDEEEEEEPPPLQAVKDQNKRLTALPPRLSLHESNDLDSWSESLFSAIPSSASSNLTFDSSIAPSTPSSSSTSYPSSSTSASTSVPTHTPKSSSSSSSSSTRQSSVRRGAPQKPIPATPLDRVAEEELPAIFLNSTGPTTPLWNEIMGMVRPQSSTFMDNTPPFTPALNEAYSPILPISPPINGYSLRREVVMEEQGEEEEEEEEQEAEDDVYLGLGRRDSNRDSSMSNVTVTGATIVRNVSIAKRARANVINRTARQTDLEASGSDVEEELIFPPTPSPVQATFTVGDTTPRNPSRHYKTPSMSSGPLSSRSLTPPPALGSPHSSYFSESSESGSECESRSSSSHPNSRRTLLENPDKPPPLPPKDPELAYLQTSSLTSPLPSPSGSTFDDQVMSARDTFGRTSNGNSRNTTLSIIGSYAMEEQDPPPKPSIVINGIDTECWDDPEPKIKSPMESPPDTAVISLSPTPRYRGWLSKVVAPLAEFIDETTDPRELFSDLQEIAEAESGSVFAARVAKPKALGLPPDTTFVAIKNVPILPSGSYKLVDLRKELTLIRGVSHENVLTMDALYVDLVEDSLWIRMELMERSLADVVGLVAEGLMVQERMIARFASDVLLALEYLQKRHISHRDVRSDNLLLNKDGVLKIADFSNAVQVEPEMPECTGAAGVIYWQAPEMRNGGPYNALKVDVWSVGATVWETAESEPPFADVQDPRLMGDRWPSLHQPEIYSRSFHEFLRLCSEPSSSRPDPSELLNTPFIRNACGRPVNVQLLSQCRAIEEAMHERENAIDP